MSDAKRAISKAARAARKATDATVARDRAIIEARATTPPATLAQLADATGLSLSRVHQIVNGK